MHPELYNFRWRESAHPNSGIYAKPLRGIPAKSYPVLVWSDDVQGAPCVQRFIAES